MPKAIHINRGVYTMDMSDKETASINMYGEIVAERPVHWWTGEPLEGDYIVQDEFLSDLESVSGAKSISVRLNSLGGDAYVSMLIHNRLRELAAKGTKLLCTVDGCAMSGGSLIMAACDSVTVNPSSIIMIHRCAVTLYGGYNADELKQALSQCETVDKAQIAIYQRKTGLSNAVLSHMMGDTTFLTGTEAVEKGFADSVIEDAEPLDIAASADGRNLYIRGQKFPLIPGVFAPDMIPTVTSGEPTPVETNTNQPAQTGDEGGKTMAKNLEELRAENPELAEALLAEAKAAVSASGAPATPTAPPASPPAAPAAQDPAPDPAKAERLRIQEIDALAGLYDAETIQAAKYGENACTAQEMTYRAAQKAAQRGKQHLDNLESDYKASGAQGVPAASDPGQPPPKSEQTPEQRMTAARTEVKALFGKEEK